MLNYLVVVIGHGNVRSYAQVGILACTVLSNRYKYYLLQYLSCCFPSPHWA